MWMRVLACLAIGTTLVAAAEPAAERTGDIVRLHIAALGGQERIDALHSFRAEGRMGGILQAHITTFAARPARLRMELRYEDHTEIGGYDGESPPWQSIIRAGEPAEIRQMSDAEAADFVADATFDDPLVASARLGYKLAFTGETKLGDHTLLRVRVALPSGKVFFLLIDPGTHLIAARVDPPDAASGATGSIVTRYENFRPVAGVLVAHQITLHVDGKALRWARLDRIEANPALPRNIFKAPAIP